MIRHRPLLTWTLGFVAGIGLWAVGWHSTLFVIVLAVCGLALLVLDKTNWVFAAVGLACLGAAAGATRLASFQAVPATDISRWTSGIAPIHIIGTVISDTQDRNGRIAFTLQAEHIHTARRDAPATGNVSVTVMPDAASSHPLDYGDRVALDGRLEVPPDPTNPGSFSWRDYLARRAVYCELRVKRQDGVQRLGASALNPYMRLAWHVRRRLLAAVRAGLPATEAAVLSGILLGKRSDLPPALTADFIHTGTVHILASAGLHVGIVAWWLFFLMERATLPRKWSAVAIILTLWLYSLMAGGRPSVTRAVIMATFYFGAILFEREPDLPTTVAASALFILALQPSALLEVGFQLSFLTVMTIIVLMPLWERFWQPRLEEWIPTPRPRRAAYWILEMLGLSLFAQIGATPIVASAYNEVSLIGFFANALVVPCLFVVIPLGFLGAMLGSLLPVLGHIVLAPVGKLITFIAWAVRSFGESSWAYRAMETPSPTWIVCYYMLLMGIASHWAGKMRQTTQSTPAQP